MTPKKQAKRHFLKKLTPMEREAYRIFAQHGYSITRSLGGGFVAVLERQFEPLPSFTVRQDGHHLMIFNHFDLSTFFFFYQNPVQIYIKIVEFFSLYEHQRKREFGI